MHLYGSLSDRNDIDYPNPQRYEFGDVDGAGSLQSAPIGNDDISDVDKCMFVGDEQEKVFVDFSSLEYHSLRSDSGKVLGQRRNSNRSVKLFLKISGSCRCI
jgi:hypothetical protein